MKYRPVIGLEVHVELKTVSKMFCGCDNDWFAKTPNTHTCPICLGLPGALPVPNKKAIEWCMRIGMALHCDIPLVSKFDRKNYFYPDLAKGYQISQYEQPFGINGFMELASGKKVRIRRVHMEEDTGKLLHEYIGTRRVSLIDFNRSGIPLVEIVTEPDFETAKEVKEYLQKLQQIVRYIGVSGADMEKGQMRLEPNISLVSTKDSEITLPGYKVEVKNINSFSFVEKAIAFEITRQEKILELGQMPTQETRGWDEVKNKTVSQRSKEEAMDYGYFPEPDIPPFHWTKQHVENLRKQLPELPEKTLRRFTTQFALPVYDAEILTREKHLADFFEEAVRVGKAHGITPKQIANVVINKKIDFSTIEPAGIIKQILTSQNIEAIGDDELERIIKEVLLSHEKVVSDYKNGKENAIQFLIGMAMKELKGKAKADIVREKIITNVRRK